MVKDGFHKVYGLKVFVKDGYVIEGYDENNVFGYPMICYKHRDNEWGKGVYITLNKFRHGVKKGTMKIGRKLVLHANGTSLVAEKTYDELTEEERKEVGNPHYPGLEGYKTFIVHRNKQGKLIRVVTGELTKEESQRIDERSGKGFFNDLVKVEKLARKGKVDREFAYGFLFNAYGMGD